MVQPLTEHPAADRTTPEALVVEQFRHVVPDSPWLRTAAAAASRDRRALQLVTSEHSRLTYPLELLLREAGADWIVREESGAHRDGFRGIPLHWNGIRFVPSPGEPRPIVPGPPPGSGDAELRITTARTGAETPRIGESAACAIRALTGRDPLGWGIAEPAAQPWGDLAAAARRVPARFVVVGSGCLGRLRLSTTDSGVVEEVLLSGPAAGSVSRHAVEALADRLAESAQTMLVSVQPGRSHGLRSAKPSPPSIPYGLLAGPELIAPRGVPHARQVPGVRAEILGAAGRHAAWYRFDGGPEAPIAQLTAVLQHFGTR
ncbi:DUF6177 family protein [Amycolatopsis sp. cg13]|uniref:DUF6177 family protein n=1 Tax=Amycolatopsis sp. cg13 TaxID=3238807 RepID=UPI0035234E3C